MKIFSLAFFAVSCTFFTYAQNSPEAMNIIEGFHQMSNCSHNLWVIVESIDLYNLYLTGPKVEDDFRRKLLPRIFQFVVDVSDIAKRGVEFNDEDSKTIAEEFSKYVEGHTSLLSMLIGRFGLLASFNFEEGIRNSLTLLECGEDAYVNALIGLIPASEKDLLVNKSVLEKGLTSVIERYGGQSKNSYYDPSAAYVEGQSSETNTRTDYKHAIYAEQYYAYYQKVAEYYRMKAAEYYEKLVPKQQHVHGSTYYRESYT